MPRKYLLNKEMKGDSRVSGLSNWVDGGSLRQKTQEDAGFGGKYIPF